MKFLKERSADSRSFNLQISTVPSRSSNHARSSKWRYRLGLNLFCLLLLSYTQFTSGRMVLLEVMALCMGDRSFHRWWQLQYQVCLTFLCRIRQADVSTRSSHGNMDKNCPILHTNKYYRHQFLAEGQRLQNACLARDDWLDGHGYSSDRHDEHLSIGYGKEESLFIPEQSQGP